MVKLVLPDFVKKIAEAFKNVVQTRVMGMLAKTKEFASAVQGLASVTGPQPALARVSTPRPPTRGGFSR